MPVTPWSPPDCVRSKPGFSVSAEQVEEDEIWSDAPVDTGSLQALCAMLLACQPQNQPVGNGPACASFWLHGANSVPLDVSEKAA